MNAALRRALLPALLALATLLAYLPSLPGEFIWDDDDYVTENEVLRDPAGLARVWVPRETPQYYPVVFSVFWLQFQAFGLNPLPYHLTNLLLHIASALLLWRLARLLGLPGPGWIAGAFALHPVHVESVAWVMELKNCLSGTLYLGAALAWLRCDGRRFGAYALALGLFALALLSKSVTCTLPAALILADLYRRRATPGRVLALLPFFALGIGAAWFTAHIEAEHVRAQGAPFAFDLAERLLIATRALTFYPLKVLAPWPLLFNYPRWELNPSSPAQWLPAAAVVAVAAVTLRAYARGRRGPFLALAFFAGTISPALGFVNYYPMLFSFVADHFAYLATIGLFALAAGAGTRLAPRVRRIVGVATLAALAVATAFQAHVFRSAESIYRHTLEHNDEAWLARATLANLLLNRAAVSADRRPHAEVEAWTAEAAEHLRRALPLATADRAKLRFSRALALYRLGRLEEALEQASKLAGKPRVGPQAESLTGSIQFELGDLQAAEESFRRVLAVDPTDSFAYQSLGDVARARGDARGALRLYRTAAELARHPVAEIRAGAALALELATSTREDLRDPDEALRLVGDLERHASFLIPEVEVARVHALARLERWPDAVAAARELLAHRERTGSPEQVERARARLEACEARRQPEG